MHDTDRELLMRAARAYPLLIVNAGEDTYIVMSKGHHDPHEFMAQVRADGYDWPLSFPEHRWARAVPTRDPYRSCNYVFTEPNARGAFPCTYAWEAYTDDRYEVRAAATLAGADGGSIPATEQKE